ncbi:hypothetical protein SADUNF_Sadunf11G0054400 [Salix dunnii]|uniref:Uncharacterized protein n=1 Tax=Salix dunnii TaxID=1413687 RepID=A0A835JKD0_9ROSI|nr:hypothetical protein SADUNF_Sadunf11G0054400 [Salix dunnii]
MERDIGRTGNSSRGSKKRKMWPFKRLKLKDSWRWRLKFLGSAFKWKRLNLHVSFFDDLIFKLVSVLEAIVLLPNEEEDRIKFMERLIGFYQISESVVTKTKMAESCRTKLVVTHEVQAGSLAQPERRFLALPLIIEVTMRKSQQQVELVNTFIISDRLSWSTHSSFIW